MKQKTAKMVEKTKRMPQEVVAFWDNFQLYQQERLLSSSLSFQVVRTTGMEAYKEEEIMDSVLKECEQFTVKLTPQCHFARGLCLMTY